MRTGQLTLGIDVPCVLAPERSSCRTRPAGANEAATLATQRRETGVGEQLDDQGFVDLARWQRERSATAA